MRARYIRAKSTARASRGVRAFSLLVLTAAFAGPTLMAHAAEPRPNAANDGGAGDEETKAARILFTGFVRRSNQSATIFVRLTSEVPVTVERAGRRVVYHLEGAKLGVANSGNPLPTEHFGPPVSHVALVSHAAGVDLVIDLTREPGPDAPKHRVGSQGSLTTLHIDLPPAAE